MKQIFVEQQILDEIKIHLMKILPLKVNIKSLRKNNLISGKNINTSELQSQKSKLGMPQN